MYLQGNELPQDKEEALRWLESSAAQGNDYAQYLIDRMEETQDPSIMLAATKLLHHASHVFREQMPPANPQGIRIDSRRRKQLLQKRLAICDDLLAFTAERRITKENGSPYTREDFRELLNDNARATMLSLFDHFAEMCTSMKTMRLLVDRKPEEISEQLERLLVIENTGNTEVFIKEEEAIMKCNSDPNIQLMVQLIARKHLFCNKNLSFNQKQKLIDKIFGKGMRKVYLAASM